MLRDGEKIGENWINKRRYRCFLIRKFVESQAVRTAPSKPKTLLTYKRPISIPSGSTPPYRLDRKPKSIIFMASPTRQRTIEKLFS